MESKDLNYDGIYFGTSRVWLREVAGEQTIAIDAGYEEKWNEESAADVLVRKSPVKDIGEEEVYVPCPPSVDLRISPRTTHTEVSLTPMIKTTKDHDGELHEGIRSGRRSAIYKHGDIFYRFKGCGNDDQGFVLEEMPFPFGSKEIRGACWTHTTVRELYMTDLVRKIEGVEIGNSSLGYWDYSDNLGNVRNDLPKLLKSCGVFKTIGEKRLSTHLLNGLLMILKLAYQQLPHNQELGERLVELFPKHRVKDEATVLVTKTTSEIRFEDPGEDGPPLLEWTSKGVYDPEKLDNLSDLVSFCHSSIKRLVSAEPPTVVFEKIVEELPVPEVLASDSKVLTQRLHEANLTFDELLSRVALIFWKCGLEVGYVKRKMQDLDISWGYFMDHNPFEPHCNAHPNNMVVVHPSAMKNNNILAPLDFDLAFTRSGFVNIIPETDLYGKKDDKLFENWVNCERHAMEEALAGQENMANFTYAGGDSTTKPDLSEKTQNELDALEIALRDTMVKAYRVAFDGKTQQHEEFIPDFGTDRVYADLISLSLVVTDHLEN